MGDFVAYRAVDFGNAVDNLEVTIFSNPKISRKNSGMPSKLLWRGVKLAHDVKLPSVVFRRKEKKLHIKWQSQNLTEDEMEVLAGPANHSVFVRAVQDVYDALVWGLNERLTTKDDFDISGCLSWVKNAQAQAPLDGKDLRSALCARSKMYLHLVRTTEFHRVIDIDWSSMHKDAAYLLYHRELWNGADERMPHGNVLGKGILENFVFYEKMSVDEILLSLGLQPYENAKTYEAKIKALQVELAFVFAHVKKRGVVQSDLVDELIRRMNIEAKNRRSFWVYRSRHGVGSHFSWMCNYLEDFTSLSRRQFPQFCQS